MPSKLSSAGMAAPDIPANKFFTANVAIPSLVSNVALPMCGTTMHLSQGKIRHAWQPRATPLPRFLHQRVVRADLRLALYDV